MDLVLDLVHHHVEILHYEKQRLSEHESELQPDARRDLALLLSAPSFTLLLLDEDLGDR